MLRPHSFLYAASSDNPRRRARHGLMRCGFTLIEIVVVIDLIALLSTILFPVFNHAREKSRQATCMLNMKQLGLAFEQYTSDNDDCLPVGVSAGKTNSAGTSSNLGEGSGWAGRIAPYAPAPGTYRCPDDHAPPPVPVTFAGESYTLVPVTYAYNSNLAGGNAGIGGHVAKMTAPAATVMLCEATCFRYPSSSQDDLNYADLSTPDEIGDQGLTLSNGCSVGSAGTLGGIVGQVYACSVPLATGYTGGGPILDNFRKKWQVPCDNSTAVCLWGLTAATGRHAGGSNYLLCDGHAQWLRGDAVGTGFTHPAGAQPTDDEDQRGTASAPGTASTQGATPGSRPFAVTFSPI